MAQIIARLLGCSQGQTKSKAPSISMWELSLFDASAAKFEVHSRGSKAENTCPILTHTRTHTHTCAALLTSSVSAKL